MDTSSFCSGGMEEGGGREEGEDQLERLPDSLLLSIFNCLHDVKSLGRCSAVSRRFRNLAVLTDCVVVLADSFIYAGPGIIKFECILGNLIENLIRTSRATNQILNSNTALLATDISHHSLSEVLRNFREIRTLKIVLPRAELWLGPGTVLKWNAESGCSLHRCAIFSAVEDQNLCTHEGPNLPWPAKLWKCLIIAFFRCILTGNILSEHPTLQSLEITDMDGRGTLKLRWDQLEELVNGSLFKPLSMKLRYAQRLELNKSGYVMDGATLLVSTGPADQPIKMKEVDEFMAGSFSGPFLEAAETMLKTKTYLFEEIN